MRVIQKKQFVKIVVLSLFFFIEVVCVYGQSYYQSLLLNKEWVLRIPGKNFYSIHFFTDKEVVLKTFINDGVKTDFGSKVFYYLSNAVVDKFEPDFIGKSNSGKYIVRKASNGNLELDEILELTETYLKTKHLRSGTVLEYKVE